MRCQVTTLGKSFTDVPLSNSIIGISQGQGRQSKAKAKVKVLSGNAKVKAAGCKAKAERWNSVAGKVTVGLAESNDIGAYTIQYNTIQ